MPRRYTDAQRQEGIELAAAIGLAAAARQLGIPKTTLRGWLRRAGREPLRTDESETARARTAAATEAALEARQRSREELADYALGELAPTAGRMIAKRLAEQTQLDAVFTEALGDLLDARQLVAAAADLGPDAAKAARIALAGRAEVLRAIDQAHVNVRTLVGVMTRAVHDHLALTGDLEELRESGELHVTFGIPRPDPDDDRGILDEPTAAARAEERQP